MRSDRIGGPLVAALFVALACAVAWPMAARAQSGDAAALQDRIARLEQEIADLRRLVTAGEIPSSQSQGPTQVGGEMPPTLAAQMQVRMSQIEQELRTITGQFEEMSFQIQQLDDRMDTALSDVEYRLSVLEGNAPGTPPPSAGATPGGSSPTTPGPYNPPEMGGAPTPVAPQPSNGGASGEPTQTASLPDGTPSEQYDHAKALLRQRQFEEAAGVLQAFIDAYPDGPLTGNAYYWLGETYYVRGMYDQAITRFGQGYKTFPDHPKAPDNLLKLAMSLGASDRTSQACAAFTELERKYPNAGSNLKSIAQQESRKLGC